jgi:hypothetical protein
MATSPTAVPDLHVLYLVLVSWAKAKKHRTYSDLSHDYLAATGVWFEPHGSWDAPLGELNRHLHGVKAPPLSAVVTKKDTGEPGGLFWGSAPSVPARPKNALNRTAEWSKLLSAVFRHPWPRMLP